ncbi:hypothetical protein KUTeg_020032 [Tegillarca granosa]|uniref:Uncharacterized protein n=1 Tax=Tegillarca granosa TaxID=220873 RepID=A0ABQ9EE56_TEGGR|nr:hypothetical protein KUTeg_020032 [Tegillarca granosa]
MQFKVTELATCIGNAFSTCDSSVAVFLPDAVAIKAAFRGICDKKTNTYSFSLLIIYHITFFFFNLIEVFQAGLTCMTNSGVDAIALATSCINTTALANIVTEATSGSWQGYCSFYVTLIDCYMDGYTCDAEFETLYKDYSKALLPSKCRDYSTSLSAWIATYGAATTQMYSLTLITIVTATGMMASYFQ